MGLEGNVVVTVSCSTLTGIPAVYCLFSRLFLFPYSQDCLSAVEFMKINAS